MKIMKSLFALIIIAAPVFSHGEQSTTAKALLGACAVGVATRLITNRMGSSAATGGIIKEWGSPEQIPDFSGSFYNTDANLAVVDNGQRMLREVYRTLGVSASIVAGSTTYKMFCHGAPSIGKPEKVAALLAAPIILTVAIHVAQAMVDKTRYYYDRNILDTAQKVTAEKLRECEDYLKRFICYPLIGATARIPL